MTTHHVAPKVDRRRALPKFIPPDRLKTIATKPSAVLQSGGQVRMTAGELMTLAAEAIEHRSTAGIEVPDIKFAIADYLEKRDEALGVVSTDEERCQCAVELHDTIQRIHAKIAATDDDFPEKEHG